MMRKLLALLTLSSSVACAPPGLADLVGTSIGYRFSAETSSAHISLPGCPQDGDDLLRVSIGDRVSREAIGVLGSGDCRRLDFTFFQIAPPPHELALQDVELTARVLVDADDLDGDGATSIVLCPEEPVEDGQLAATCEPS